MKTPSSGGRRRSRAAATGPGTYALAPEPLPPPPIEFAGDRLRVVFDRFDLAAYGLFLRCKQLPESEVAYDPAAEVYTLSAPARFAPLLGTHRPVARDPFPLSDFLFDDQAELTAYALDCKRFALWCLCGWGKTIVGLEFGRQASMRAGGRALIVTTNDLVPQWIEEAGRFFGGGLPVARLQSREELRRWCKAGEVLVGRCEACGRRGEPRYAGDGELVLCPKCDAEVAGAARRVRRPRLAVVNYEKFNPDADGQVVNECRHLVCVVLDEGSRLRNSGGKQKWALIKSMKGVEYKLILTATPAPNDLMEFASQAAFLEKMRSEGDIIWTFFTRDPTSHRWTVKPHARSAFFAFMANWSVYVNDPKRYGWRQGHPDVPRPEYRVVEVPATPEQLAEVPAAVAVTGGQTTMATGATNAIQRVKLSEVAKGFRYVARRKGQKPGVRRIPSDKPAVVADLVRAEAAAGEQVLVWTLFDEETAILGEHLAGLDRVEVLTGKVKVRDRGPMIDRFKAGETRVLVTRAKMLGYGMNLQMCGAMVFSGFSDSFEDMFQAIRRAVRHGQTRAVRVYFPFVRELEGDTLDNLRRKEDEFMRSIAEMEDNYIRARARLIRKDGGA